ncbi:37S ribosomal protein S16, mitochondrial [Nowakowskiella sp. JEL0407]|nr:37S ribosomal protein S16, mitochondrial [Nowakowskiella sp. JEL0407]
MPLRIRLSCWGVRHNPFYGIVVANARSPRDRKFIEKLGSYNPIPTYPTDNPFSYSVDDLEKEIRGDEIQLLDSERARILKTKNNGAVPVKHMELDTERIKYWLSVGAQPTSRVAWLLEKAGIMPPLPEQLQKQGKISLSDPKTWDVEVKDVETGKLLKTISARDLRAAYNGEEQNHATPWVNALRDPISKLPPITPPKEPEPAPKSLLTYENVKLDGKKPKKPLTPSEILQGRNAKFATFIASIASTFNYTPTRLSQDIIYGEQILNCVSLHYEASLLDSIAICQDFLDSKFIAPYPIKTANAKFRSESPYTLTVKGVAIVFDFEENGKTAPISTEKTNRYRLYYPDMKLVGSYFPNVVLSGMFRTLLDNIEIELVDSESQRISSKAKTFFLKKFTATSKAYNGSDVIEWVLENCAVWNRDEAVLVASSFLNSGWIAAVNGSPDEKIIKDGKSYQITNVGIAVIKLESEDGKSDEPAALFNVKSNDSIDSAVGYRKSEVTQSSSPSFKKQRPISAMIGSENWSQSSESSEQRPRSRGRSVTVSEANPSTSASALGMVLQSAVGEKVVTTSTGSRRRSINALELVSKESRGAKLNQVLQNPQLLQAFGEFLRTIFCYENLQFWEDVEKFRTATYPDHRSSSVTTETLGPEDANNPTPTMMIPHAIALYLKYIVTDSPYEVNIGTIKKDIQSNFEQARPYFQFINPKSLLHEENIDMDDILTPGVTADTFPKSIDGFSKNMFSVAHSHIFRLMATDSIPKFMKTTAYSALASTISHDTSANNFAMYTEPEVNSSFVPRTSLTNQTLAQNSKPTIEKEKVEELIIDLE